MQLAEQNYKIYDKELLVIVEALAKWRQYLLDAAETFKIWTDHKNLKYFWKPHKLNRQQTRWYLKLQDYDFVLWHISEKTNMKADILSRKEQVNTKEDNKDVQLLKNEIWTRKTTVKITMLGRKMITEERDIVKKIRRNNTRGKEIIQALEKKDGLAWEEDGMAYMEERIYVPNNKKLREEILKEYHDPVDIGHLGQHKMLELLKRNSWCLGLKEDIKKYMQGCFKCQQNKVQYQWRAGELHPLKILKGPWQEITIDIIGPLPSSNGMDAILVIMDRFTKIIRLKAIMMNILSEEIVKIYRDKIWKLHGVSRTILSNWGPQFTLKFMKEFTKVLRTKRKLSMAYHPQIDGQTERIN